MVILMNALKTRKPLALRLYCIVEMMFYFVCLDSVILGCPPLFFWFFIIFALCTRTTRLKAARNFSRPQCPPFVVCTICHRHGFADIAHSISLPVYVTLLSHP